MAAPVRPPMPDTVFAAALDALDKALPAELVTLDRPCCALLAASEAPSFALLAPEEAALVAASVVEDAARLCSSSLDCRMASRGILVGIIVEMRSRDGCSVNGQLLIARCCLLPEN